MKWTQSHKPQMTWRSCSTTTTEVPLAASSLMAAMTFSVRSSGRPAVGSSSSRNDGRSNRQRTMSSSFFSPADMANPLGSSKPK